MSGIMAGKSEAPTEKPSVEFVGYRQIAMGINVFDTPHITEGVVTGIRNIDEMMPMVALAPEELAKMIILVPSGTVSFVTPVLPYVKGVLTVAGAPESHVGILSREFQVPAIMTLEMAALTERYRPGDEKQEAVGGYFDQVFAMLRGKHVLMDCRRVREGRLYIKE